MSKGRVVQIGKYRQFQRPSPYFAEIWDYEYKGKIHIYLSREFVLGIRATL